MAAAEEEEHNVYGIPGFFVEKFKSSEFLDFRDAQFYQAELLVDLPPFLKGMTVDVIGFNLYDKQVCKIHIQQGKKFYEYDLNPTFSPKLVT